MDFSKVLSRAWEITWRWKVLWILGFLAALGNGGGGGGGSNYAFDSSNWDPAYGYYAPRIPPGVVGALFAVACLAIIFAIALWVVSVIARGGLIAGVHQIEEEGATTFGQAWRAGASRFWTLFGIGILAAIPLIIAALVGFIVIIVMFVGSGFAFTSSDAAGAIGIAASILCGGAFCCGMIIATIILQQIRIYAERAAVLEGLGWIDAFVRGWDVLKTNLGPTIIFWIIFFVIGLALALVIGAIIFMLMIPLIAVMANVDPGLWMVVPGCFGGLLAIIIAALVSAIVETFVSSTWTLAYREMTGLAAQPVAEPAAEA